MNNNFELFCVCPECRSELVQREANLICTACSARFEIKENIAVLLPSYKEDSDLRERYLKNYDQIADDDLRQPVVENRAEVLHAKLKYFIGDLSGKTVLDIGSAYGSYLTEIRAKYKVGVDIALPYLKTISLEPNTLLVCGDAEFLPVKLSLFDVVIISDVLEHLLEPEKLVSLLVNECRKDVRIIVHIPWEETLDKYKDVKYEFVHLRSFNTYNFRLLFKRFYVAREACSLPILDIPLIFALERYLPRFIFNGLLYLTFKGKMDWFERKRDVWINELPKREKWLLLFYKPVVKMFDLRKYPNFGAWFPWRGPKSIKKT